MTGRFRRFTGGRVAAGTMAVIGAALPIALATASLAGCTSSPARGPAFALQQQYEAVIKSVLPSVVQVNTGTTTGSGIVYDGQGDIVTNAHVVGDAMTLKVVDLSGHVIGVPTAAARDPKAGPAPGIGFAIPSDTVTSIAGQLISTGKVTRSR
jgi:S1-C subfamily serine protease